VDTCSVALPRLLTSLSVASMAMTRFRGKILVPAALAVLAGSVLWFLMRTEVPRQSYQFEGKTMGTTYLVRAHGPVQFDPAEVQKKVEGRLAELNRALSTWDPNSELSRFNALPPGQVIMPSNDFSIVLSAALRLWEATGGAFDPTVGPVVDLWGFGPPTRNSAPTEAELDAARSRIGTAHLLWKGGRLQKDLEGVRLDFSGIAKGYGVDEVGHLLEKIGLPDYLVEIGGEVAVKGNAPDGDPWRVGVEFPVESTPQLKILVTTLRVSNAALATSGDYRNFKNLDGKRVHHIIDPRTGHPTDNGVVSVTVYARDCMTADGMATALMVMGVTKGMALVEKLDELEVMMIERLKDGTLKPHRSKRFPALEEKGK